MRIVMVLTVLAPIGGIEAALVPLCLALKAGGHLVSVYTLHPVARPNQNAEALAAAGISVLAASTADRRLAQAGAARRSRLAARLTQAALPGLLPVAVVDAVRRQRPIGRSLRGAAGRWHALVHRRLDFEPWYYRQLGQLLRQAPPDVVHVHGWGCGDDPPGALSWLSRLSYPVVYTEHNSPDPALQRPVDQAPMNLADQLIAVSRAGEAGLRQVGRAQRPITVIPYSVEPVPAPAAFSREPGFTIVCVARLSAQKRQTDLINAMPAILARVPGARLLLAGEGPTRPELDEQVAALGLGPCVQFLGAVTRAQLPELLAKSDVFVLPSIWEGLPVALIEALSAGKPIVATDVGGNAELVTPGQNGWLVPPGNVAALAEAVVRIATDCEAARRMGAASRSRFDSGEFAPSAVAARHLEVYQRAQDARRSPSVAQTAE